MHAELAVASCGANSGGDSGDAAWGETGIYSTLLYSTPPRCCRRGMLRCAVAAAADAVAAAAHDSFLFSSYVAFADDAVAAAAHTTRLGPRPHLA